MLTHLVGCVVDVTDSCKFGIQSPVTRRSSCFPSGDGSRWDEVMDGEWLEGLLDESERWRKGATGKEGSLWCFKGSQAPGAVAAVDQSQAELIRRAAPK